MRLRPKLSLAFFIVSSSIAIVLALFLYRFIQSELTDELHARLQSLATLGAADIEPVPYGKLRAQLGDLSDSRIATIEHSEDFREVDRHLQEVRSAEGNLVRYVYILAPTTDPNHPVFVADADVLALDARVARGETLGAHDEISHFGQPYDVSNIPLLAKALANCTPEFEPDFVYDQDFDVSSVSAYVPLTDDNGVALRDADGKCYGVMGVDITDRKMRDELGSAGVLAVKISIAVIIAALVISVGMGTVLTRSLLALSQTVRRFAAKDFSARTSVHSHDEVGQLGDNFNAMASTIQIHNEHLEELVAVRTAELVAARETSERLLLNVLPAPIADRLKAGETLIVDRFDSVSVLFADIVGFTAMSAKTSPEALVTMLNEVFSAFDRLADKHGLEKIKTIGDAYMVVSGIPTPRADHVHAIARMALDMTRAVTDYAGRSGHALAIRTGIHTGPVIAGVIGEKKFIYDLWGDTVNTASRMESHGVPGRVHVTATVADALADEFELEAREPIEVKGKGKMSTYLLTGPRGNASASGAS